MRRVPQMRQCRLHVPQIGQAAETLGASQLADHTETVDNRHLQIQEHSIGRISMDEVKGFTSVCLDHAVPTASKSSAIVRPRPDGGIRASYFGAGRPAWLFQRSPNILLIPDTSSTSHLREGVTRNFWKGQSHLSLSILGNLPRTRSRGH